MRFAARASWSVLSLGRTLYDYRHSTGDGRGNAIVMACILWMCRTLPESPLRAQLRKNEGWEYADEQEIEALVQRPNPFYSGELLWWGTLGDWMATGNAYWRKVMSAAGRVVELWWIPSTMLEPRWPESGEVFISHYDYTVDGRIERIEPADIVHFRYGLDPANVRKGLSPLGSLLREVFTDDEAANFSASLLRNLGVPGVIIAPAEDMKLSPEEGEQVKGQFETRFGGDNRGRALVMSKRVTTTVLSFSPQQMDLKVLRRLPEERVSAIFGTPAVVVGLGAGLDRSTFANFAEAREAAYESNILPSQRLLSADLNVQLVPDFGDPTKLRLAFDNSGVRVLQEDEDKKHARAREDLKAGLITRAQALSMVGMDADKDADVLYVPISVTPTAPADLLSAEPVSSGAPPANPAAGNAGKGRRSRKDAESLAGAIERLRRRLQPGLERELGRFLGTQAQRVVSRLEATRKAVETLPDPEELLPDDERRLLRDLLEPWYRRTLIALHELTQDALGVSFELDDPLTRQYLGEAGTNIVAISDTTLQAVRDALAEGQAAGEGLSELAKRLRELPQFGKARARVVARTELAQASNLAALTSYTASGVVVGVQVFDGDFDEVCAALNGQLLSLADARNLPPLAHPNCLRALGPVTDAAMLENAA